MGKFLLVSAIAVLAMACGSAGAVAVPSPSPSPSPSSGLGFDVTATEKDHAVSMRIGQKLEVVLHGGDTARWQQVHATDATILEPVVDPAATAVRGVTLAAFKALAAGQTTVTAVGTPVCPSGQACPMYAILYQLTVTVTP